MNIIHLNEIPDIAFKELGYPYETKCSDFVELTVTEADAYYTAAVECFKMVDAATESIIYTDDGLKSLGIPEYMFKIMRKEYKNFTFHPHMIGRFDFAGGLKDVPIKLMEFNGDTPFSIFETAIVQYVLAKHNDLDPDTRQYNTLWEKLNEFFKYLATVNPNRKLLFTNAKDGEDDLTTVIIRETSLEYFTESTHKYWTDVANDNYYGVVSTYTKNDENGNPVEYIEKAYDTIIKMVPWDMMYLYDKKMAEDFANAMMRHNIVCANPSYASVYQNKKLMEIMYKMYPDSPYLLETTSDTPYPSLVGYVSKPVWGREGDNISIDADNKTDGNYSDVPRIYQKKANMIVHDGMYYQAGVFISMEDPCGISFRRSSSPIITSDSEICGHITNS